MFEQEFIDVICCPLGKAPLNYENNSLVCTKCGLIYPIIDEIPALLIDEAKLPEGITSISDLKCQKEKS